MPSSDPASGGSAPWRFARTMAAAERSRAAGAGETWDRTALPEDMRGALRDRPRFGHRWRELLYRLAPRPASPRYRPPSAPVRAAAPEPSEPPAPLPKPGGPDVPTALPPPHPSAGPWRTTFGGLHGLLRALVLEGARHRPEASASVPAPLLPPERRRRADALALRFWPHGKPDPERAVTGRLLRRPVRPPQARRDAGADPGAASTRAARWRATLLRAGGSRHAWLAVALLLLLVLVGHEAMLDLRPRPNVQPPGPGLSDGRAQAPELRDDLTAALEQYRRASELDPTNPLLLYRWAVALEQHGELEQALAVYRRAAALSLRAPSGAGD